MTRMTCTVAATALLAMSAATGCTALVIGAAAAVAAAGTYVYTEGRVESTENAPVEKVYDATLLAMKEMEFETKEQAKDATAARVVAQTSDDTDVKVAIDRKSEELTEVRIRVGVFGDEKLSTQILQKIRENLGKA